MSRNHLTRRVGRVRALVIGAAAAGSLALATALGLQVAAGESSTSSASSSATATTGSSDTSSSTSGSTSGDGSGLVSGSSGTRLQHRDHGRLVMSAAALAARDWELWTSPCRIVVADVDRLDAARRDRRRAAGRGGGRGEPVPSGQRGAEPPRPAGTTCRRCWPTWCARHWSPRGSATERSTRPWARRWSGLGYDRTLAAVRSRRPAASLRRTLRGRLAEPPPGRLPAVPARGRSARPRGHRQGRRRRPDGGRDRRRARHRCPGQPRWRHRDVGPGTGRRLAGDGAGPAHRRSPAGDPARGRRHRHLEHREAHLAARRAHAPPPGRPRNGRPDGRSVARRDRGRDRLRAGQHRVAPERS